jgi:small-conductance mechanosensitive channel
MWQILGVLVIMGLVLHYIWWIIAAVAAWYAVKALRVAWLRHEAQARALMREQAAVAARADEQHQQVMRGDDRGLWGVAGPAMRKYEREVKR